MIPPRQASALKHSKMSVLVVVARQYPSSIKSVVTLTPPPVLLECAGWSEQLGSWPTMSQPLAVHAVAHPLQTVPNVATSCDSVRAGREDAWCRNYDACMHEQKKRRVTAGIGAARFIAQTFLLTGALN